MTDAQRTKEPICIEAYAQADDLDRMGRTDSAPLLRRMADQIERLKAIAKYNADQVAVMQQDRDRLQRLLDVERRALEAAHDREARISP